jgi:hypothetical protein
MKKTKLIVASAAILAGVVAAMPSQALARCYCEAASNSAWGWGDSNSCSWSQQRALAECAALTPRTEWCYVTFCDVY